MYSGSRHLRRMVRPVNLWRDERYNPCEVLLQCPRTEALRLVGDFGPALRSPLWLRFYKELLSLPKLSKVTLLANVFPVNMLGYCWALKSLDVLRCPNLLVSSPNPTGARVDLQELELGNCNEGLVRILDGS